MRCRECLEIKEKLSAICIVLFFLLFVLCWGEPDILDGLIKVLNK